MVTDRGAVVKAMAICTRHSFLHIYKVKISCCISFQLVDYLVATSITCPRRIFQIAFSRNVGSVI